MATLISQPKPYRISMAVDASESKDLDIKLNRRNGIVYHVNLGLSPIWYNFFIYKND